MAKIVWIELRLDRWAAWRIQGRRLGSGASCHPMWRDMPPDPAAGYEARVPLNEEECWQTDKAVMALEPQLAELVAAYYLHGGLFALDRLKISRSTMQARLTSAHALLARALERPAPVGSRGPNYSGLPNS